MSSIVEAIHRPQSRFPRGFAWLMFAQFLSALADNALLIVTVAHLQHLGAPAWWAPFLKFCFTVAYVVLAPFVGAWADAVCKKRLMVLTHSIKLLGAGMMALGLHPLAAFALIGLGASAYAPAKYGLVTESVAPSSLVAANGWIETGAVLSVLLGTALGGLWVSPLWLHAFWMDRVSQCWPMVLGHSSPGLNVSLSCVLAVYLVSLVGHLGIVPSGARKVDAGLRPWFMVQSFRTAHRTLRQDPSGGLSLAVTTVFWGLGAMLQFAVLNWGINVLGLGLDRAAWLQGVVALGVVMGAALIATRIPLRRASGVLPLGIVLGLVLAVAPWFANWWVSVPALVVIGAIGGIMVVPMNALLQHRGHRLLGAGQSIAVQGLNENLSILVVLGLYACLLALNVPVQNIMTGAGVVLALAMVLTLRRRRIRIRRMGPLARLDR